MRSGVAVVSMLLKESDGAQRNSRTKVFVRHAHSVERVLFRVVREPAKQLPKPATRQPYELVGDAVDVISGALRCPKAHGFRLSW